MKKLITIVVALLVTLVSPKLGFSQAGTLDAGYGNNGTVLFDPGPSHDVAYDLVVLDDTSTIVLGITTESSATVGCIMHIQPDGSQDMNFGTNGIITLQYGVNTYTREIEMQSDGKFIVAGLTYVTASDAEFFIARFNPDFSPDLTFNSTGHFITSYSSSEESLEALTIQDDGKYILAGRTYLGSFSQLLFARVNIDGTLDTSFGNNGYTEIDASPQDERINSVKIMSDGTIIGFGYGYQSTPYFGELVFMAKLTSAGAPYPGFGTNGVVIPPVFDDISTAYDFVISDDSLFVIGWMYDISNNEQFFIAKLDLEGNVYPSFGTNGITFLLVDPVTVAFRLMRLGDGKFYAAGTTGLGGPSDREFLLIRILPDGTLDPSFNGTGYVTTDIQPAWDEAYGIGIQPDGKIVLAGMSSGFPDNPNYIGMARYLNDYVPAGCYANFTVDDTLTCEGYQVQYTDLTVSTDSVAVSWQWTFEGGTPAISNVQNPTVTYNTAGVYDVQLVVGDGIYTDSLMREDYITVEAIPAQPAMPTGPADLCGGYSGDYSISPLMYSTTYNWDLSPSEAGILTENGTTATFEASATWTGICTITVQAQGYCGVSPWSPAASIEVHNSPVTFQLTGDGLFCAGTTGAEIGLAGSETGVDYELYLDGDPTGNIVAGTGTEISFGELSVEGLYTALGYTDYCSEQMIGQVYVHEIDQPQQAGIPLGPDQVCDYDTSYYTTAILNNVDYYAWTLSPEEAGVISSTDENATIYWNQGFSGTAELSVHGENECGEGPESPVLQIEVNTPPAPTISGPQQVCSDHEETYQTEEISGDFYSWEVTGGIITGGSGTFQVTVLWGDPGSGTVTVMEQTPEGCITITDTYDVVIEDCTGLDEPGHNTGFQLYPNPADDIVNLVIGGEKTGNLTIIVISQTGQRMMTEHISSPTGSYQFNISGLSQGIYMVRITREGDILFSERIIKH